MNYEKTLERLNHSTFRSRFHLSLQDKKYVVEKGIATIQKHAYDFVHQRLGPAVILHDGKQTPMKGHPVFVAQHATATCCRECMRKWHHIPSGVMLTSKQENEIVGLIVLWIQKEMENKNQF